MVKPGNMWIVYCGFALLRFIKYVVRSFYHVVRRCQVFRQSWNLHKTGTPFSDPKKTAAARSTFPAIRHVSSNCGMSHELLWGCSKLVGVCRKCLLYAIEIQGWTGRWCFQLWETSPFKAENPDRSCWSTGEAETAYDLICLPGLPIIWPRNEKINLLLTNMEKSCQILIIHFVACPPICIWIIYDKVQTWLMIYRWPSNAYR